MKANWHKLSDKECRFWWRLLVSRAERAFQKGSLVCMLTVKWHMTVWGRWLKEQGTVSTRTLNCAVGSEQRYSPWPSRGWGAHRERVGIEGVWTLLSVEGDVHGGRQQASASSMKDRDCRVNTCTLYGMINVPACGDLTLVVWNRIMLLIRSCIFCGICQIAPWF